MVPQGSTTSNLPLQHSVALEAGRASAVASPTVAAALRDLLQHGASAWPGFGFEVVKERTVRTVLRGRLGDVAAHVKLFRTDTLADRARDALRGPRGARELGNLERARDLGLPVVEPLACGMAVDGDHLRSFVVTRTVADAAPFTFAAAPKVMNRVGGLLRTMHDRGFLPLDLHPGNLLVDAGGEPWLLDLTSVRHTGDVQLRARAVALAFFCHELDGGVLDSVAAPLLDGYLGAGPDLPAGLRDECVLASHRWRADALPAFGRRSTRNCRHTEVPARRRGEPRWHWHLAPGTDAVREACRALADAPPVPTKTGRRGSVWVAGDLVMKERDQGAARKLWRAAYWLLFAGVPTAQPLALRTFRGRGLVLCRRIDAEPLSQRLSAGLLGPAQVTAAARSLGHGTGRMHAHGLRNRDLKLDNLVQDPSTGDVCMVDLDGVRRNAVPDVRGNGADLGRLLAAFRAAGSPGGAATVRTFLRAWLRSHRRLLQRPQLRRVLASAERRAGEWASAHRDAAG